jgi:hypothetical protein
LFRIGSLFQSGFFLVLFPTGRRHVDRGRRFLEELGPCLAVFSLKKDILFQLGLQLGFQIHCWQYQQFVTQYLPGLKFELLA